MSFSGVTEGLEWGILAGIFSWGWGTVPELALGCRGGMLGMGHHSQLCPGAGRWHRAHSTSRFLPPVPEHHRPRLASSVELHSC